MSNCEIQRVDLVDRYRVEKVQTFSTASNNGDEIRLNEDVEVLSRRLACHVDL